MASITVAELNKYVGKNIKDICGNGYLTPSHCAHFVSHVMSYTFGYTCKIAGTGKGPAANLRVHEVFPRCPSVGNWSDRPQSLDPCLIFITNPAWVDLTAKTIENHPTKHIGIYVGGTIWHYSNSHGKVVTQTPDQFSHHYPAPNNSLFYGQLIP